MKRKYLIAVWALVTIVFLTVGTIIRTSLKNELLAIILGYGCYVISVGTTFMFWRNTRTKEHSSKDKQEKENYSDSKTE